MKLKVRKLIALGMMLALILTNMLCVSAAESQAGNVQPRYTYISSFSAEIVDLEDDTADFNVKCIASSSVTSIDFDVTLQKKGLLGVYTKVDSVSRTFSGNYKKYVDTFDIDSSETYRIKAKVTVHTANDSESDTMYSDPT